MSKQRERRRERRQARAQSEQRVAERQSSYWLRRTWLHWLELDLLFCWMERSPRATRIGLAFGVVGLVLAIWWLVSGLLGI